MYDEQTAYAPFLLYENDHQPGGYTLFLDVGENTEPIERIFMAAGYEGGGYDWSAVALQAGRECGIDTRFGIDPEGSMFVAYGDELKVLQQLAEVLRDAFHDHGRLRALIAAANPDDFD